MEVKIQEELVLDKERQSKGGIWKKIVDSFKAPPDVPVMEDNGAIEKTYSHWRLRIFYSIFASYTCFYLCKKNISLALPQIQANLGYTKTELGILGSTLYFTYAIGKFVNGVLADRSNVRTFLPTALIMSAVANICFVLSSIFITPGQVSFFGLPSASILLWAMAFFWGANGWFQSMGFPASAKSLTFWYSNSERGMKWSLWSISHQVGTTLSIIFSGFIISHFGWRAAFYMPAILAIILSLVLFERLRDKPTTIGLPDIEEYREPECVLKNKSENPEEDNTTYLQIFKEHVLFNKTIWLLAFAYIFVYIIRFGTEDWMAMYLQEYKKNSPMLAATKLSFLPFFGIVGTLSAGFISDKVFKGKRAPINVIFLAGIVAAVVGLKLNTLHGNLGNVIDIVCLAFIGMFTYGPQMLIGGLCAVESSSKKVASAASGFTGSFGYVGAVISGVGTGILVDKFGWNGAIYLWIASAVACILLCLPLWNHKSSCK